MLHLDVRWPRVLSLSSLSVEEVILPYLGCVQELYVMANPAIPSFPRREVGTMRRKPRTRKPNRQRAKLGLPDLEHVKSAVLVTLRSPESQPSYRHSILISFAGIA